MKLDHAGQLEQKIGELIKCLVPVWFLKCWQLYIVMIALQLLLCCNKLYVPKRYILKQKNRDLNRRIYRSTLPAPFSYMLGPESFASPSTNACFMLARFNLRYFFYQVQEWHTRKHTTPTTTGLATLVTDKLLQPALIFDPIMSRPYATMSGFTRP